MMCVESNGGVQLLSAKLCKFRDIFAPSQSSHSFKCFPSLGRYTVQELGIIWAGGRILALWGLKQDVYIIYIFVMSGAAKDSVWLWEVIIGLPNPGSLFVTHMHTSSTCVYIGLY